MALSCSLLCTLVLFGGVASATCPVTSTTVPPGSAVGCQTVSVNGIDSVDLGVAGALVALTLGALFMRAVLGRR